MKQKNIGRLVVVIGVLLWSLYELYPPQSKDLVQVFRDRAVNHDAAFAAIAQRAQDLEKQQPDNPYRCLATAVGTNDLTKYFPFFEAGEQERPNAFILNRLQREAAGRIRLGLDLQGGTSFTVQMDTKSLTNDVGGALSQAVEVLRRRVDRFGVAEPLILPQGDDKILVQLPGLSDADQEDAEIQIKRAAYLEFRMVHPQSREFIEQGNIEPGYEVMKLVERHEGKETVEPLLVKRRPELNGDSIQSAMVGRGNMGEPDIDFTLNPDGASRFADVTRENIGRRLAIVLDGKLYSAPFIRGVIDTGRGQITGRFDYKEAQELASVLENPLRAKLDVIASSKVAPTLGRDAIKSGVMASIGGTVAVSLFMLCYYLISGMVANVALLANILILLGVMCSIGTTLTLPGIAGIVLTVGMAVDANVLIYERIREETARGKSLRGAVAAGYSRAFTTIFDSHVTTLISSIILIFMGTGSIKGFGVALTIGVAASLFTALVVTRLIFDFLLDRSLLTSLKMLHLIPATLNLDFMKLARVAFATSWIIIVIGVGYGGYKGRAVMGRDFIGGDTTSCAYKQQVGEQQIRAALKAANISDPQIQYQTDLVSGKASLRIDSPSGTGAGVKAVLEKLSPNNYSAWGQEHVGPSVGKEIQKSAVIASLLSLFGILIYVAVRYEFSFAVGAVLAVIHDVLMTIGIYCLCGRQFSATTVAAILTIIGFSTNDTIVIFDRIREDLKLGIRGTFKEVMNQALNQTLSRTIITSGTVFLATAALYLFGGGDINDFAFTFLIGIVTGTYSSIYIASALVLFWHKGQRPHIGSAPTVIVEGPTPAGARE